MFRWFDRNMYICGGVRRKNQVMIVFSCFDGMSCGQIALSLLGRDVDVYYASEVDKYAMEVTMNNFPGTVQVGDIRNVDPDDYPKIDLFIGGSPCQSFSMAGKRKGMSTKDSVDVLTIEQYLALKADGFEFEGQSYLFWEYMRLLEAFRVKNPDIKFMLENVIMEERWKVVLTRAIGINPIRINASLVSAQNRDRYYWTNIGSGCVGLFGDVECLIPQPDDCGVLLKDVLEDEVDEKYFLSDEAVSVLLKHKARHKEQGNGFGAKFHGEDEKMQSLKVGGKGIDDLVIVASRGRNPQNPKSRKSGDPTEQHLEPRYDGKTNCLTSVAKDNLVMQINGSTESGGKQPYQQNRVYDINGQSPALMAQMSCGSHAILEGARIRRLTPTECERLQTVPVGYTQGVSDTQRYRMLGNGWCIAVIMHIFSYL